MDAKHNYEAASHGAEHSDSYNKSKQGKHQVLSGKEFKEEPA